MSYFGLDKLTTACRIISKNGGLFGSLRTMLYTDTLKEGTYMGYDCFGNKYYENRRYMMGRSRWVEYNPLFRFDYDASTVTPQWHGWLHYHTDRLPCQDPAKVQLECDVWSRRWMLLLQ